MTVWDVLAGSRAARGLATQMRSSEVAHAWLLLGPRGAGKRSAALAMAASLNCEEQPGVGCGICSTCRRILRRTHPDVHHVVPEGPLIPVDVIREAVLPEAARSPFEAHRKVFVVEEAERMNEAAQSSLLKTLEEPHPDTVFVLISDREDELLETIRSRCRTVRLEPLSEDQVVEALTGQGIDRTAATIAARASVGDIDRARSLATNDSPRGRRELWATIPERLSGPLAALDVAGEIVEQARLAARRCEEEQKQEITDLAEAMGEGRGTAAARNALAKRHKREVRRVEEEVLGEALEFLASFYRDVVAWRRGTTGAIVNLDVRDRLPRWAEAAISDQGLLAAAERCIHARESLTRNANVPLAIEGALLEVVRHASGGVVTAA